jgi:hypothetical protein
MEKKAILIEVDPEKVLLDENGKPIEKLKEIVGEGKTEVKKKTLIEVK